MCKALDDLYQDGVSKGLERGIEQGLVRGIEQGIRVLITDYLEEGYDKDKIIGKLLKRFSLSGEDALKYYNQFANVKVPGV